MDLFTITRYVLYAISWIWTTVIWGATLNNNVYNPSVNFCAFDNKLSNCRAIIAFGIIAWLLLTIIIILRLLSTFLAGKLRLPERWEFLAFVALTVWWIIPAIVASVGLQKSGTGRDNAVVAFSWMNIFFSAILAAIAWWKNRNGDDGVYGVQDRPAEPMSMEA